MSFLNSAGAGAAAANGASTGLGHMLGVDPSRISSIANSIGTGMNGIAAAGGAPQAYGGQAGPQQPVNNYMQMMDPTVLKAILAKFGPAQNTGMVR